MTDSKHFDVAIIGAGTAGLSARREVARRTDRYVLVDPGPLGTSCARAACMPSKTLIQAANLYHQTRHAPAGLTSACEGGELDTEAVMRHVRQLRDSFVAGVIHGMQGWRDTHFIARRARFLDAHTLDLASTAITADRIIVATGSAPVIPQPWQQHRQHLLDTDRFFELAKLPASIIVIGLGPVGLELAQAMVRLGVSVTGIDPDRSIGGLSDPDLQNYAIEHLSDQMTLYLAPADITQADAEAVRVTAGGRTVQAQSALIATGRRPAVRGLGLEALGVALDDRGLPAFDPATLQVDGLPVFLAGDVNGVRPLLHEAADEGRIAGYNATQDAPEQFARRTLLAITFSSPTIAVVGNSFQELQGQGQRFVTGRAGFEHQGRARIMDAASGQIRIYASPDQGRLLGAELFAPGGEHLAHLLAWAISARLRLCDLLGMPYYHPVLEEGLRSAIRDAAGQLDSAAAHTELMRCEANPVA